jgi:hypothetical protein
MATGTRRNRVIRAGLALNNLSFNLRRREIRKQESQVENYYVPSDGGAPILLTPRLTTSGRVLTRRHRGTFLCNTLDTLQIGAIHCRSRAVFEETSWQMMARVFTTLAFPPTYYH